MMRKLESRVSDRGPHAIATLFDGRIGQAHHREVGEPEGDVYFDVNRIGLHTEDRCTA
jgi:hypothetical protein